MVKKFLIIFLIFAITEIPFINKPYNIDDWAFLRGGEIMAERLFHKSDKPLLYGNVDYFGLRAKIYETPNPLFPFIYAGFIIKTTHSRAEWIFHLYFFLFLLIASIGAYYFSKGFNLDFYPFAILLFSTPVFFVNSLNVMSDIIGFSFFLLGMGLFFYNNKGKVIINILSGLSFSIAIFSVYQTTIAFLIVILYILLYHKDWKKSVYPLLLPFITLALWVLYYIIIYKKFTFTSLYTHMYFRPFYKRGISYFSYIGGSTIFFPFLLIPFIKRWKDFVIYAIFWVLSLFLSQNNATGIINFIMLSFFLSTGMFVSFKIGEKGIIGVGKENKIDVFFSLWYWGYLIAAIIFLPFGSARYTLYLLLPLFVFFFREAKGMGKNFYISAISLTFISSIFVGIGDYQYGMAYKRFVKEFSYEYRGKNAWFTGEWGFRWYMEEKGYKYLLMNENRPAKNDIVVIPDIPCPQRLSDALNVRLYGIKTYIYNSKFPIRVMSKEGKTGFYSDAFGILPYSISTTPLEHISVFRVGEKNYFLNLKNAEIKTDVKGFKPVLRELWDINNIPKNVIFEHPTTSISYRVKIPENARLKFSIALKPDVWDPKKGDGVEFIIKLRTRNSELRTLFSKYIDPKHNLSDRKWHNEEVDLSEYEGKEIILTFTTLPGPKENTGWDWAGWGEPEIKQ